MRPKNQKYTVTVVKDHQFKLYSSENKPYDAVYYMEKFTDNQLICAYEITIKNHDEMYVHDKCIALIGCIYGNAKHCAVIIGNRLAVLIDDWLAFIDLANYELIAKIQILTMGSGFALYEFGAGLLVHGELDIVKTDCNGKIEWLFSGRDIWVTTDGSEALRIEDDMIFLTDFNGDTYTLDCFGKAL